MSKNIYDVVIIGSGYGGMLPAYKLAKSGRKVLLIERGKHLRPQDFKQELTLEYLASLYDISNSRSLRELYRGSRVLGGGSVTNDKIHHRAPSEIFNFEDENLGSKAWPDGINRQVLDPYYEEVEQLLSIKQINWDQVSMIGGNFARLFSDAGMSCEPCNFNVGSGCVHCGYCESGCSFINGKLTLETEVFWPAMETGNLTLITEYSAKSIKQLRGGEYRVDLVKTSKNSLRSVTSKTVFGKKVICAAGPIGTVPLLIRSTQYLKKLSPTLGKYISNNGDINFVLKIPDHYPDHYGYKSDTSCGTISYAFWDKHHVTMHAGMTPIQVAAGVDVRREGGLPWGLDHKHFMKENVLHRLIPANGMGPVPSDMSMDINFSGFADISNPVSPGQEKHIYLMYNLLKNLMEEVNGELLLTGKKYPFDLGGNHILGGARISNHIDSGVCNPKGEVFNYSGLYVSDAASIPSCLSINPAHTIAANALRIADEIMKSDGDQI